VEGYQKEKSIKAGRLSI